MSCRKEERGSDKGMGEGVHDQNLNGILLVKPLLLMIIMVDILVTLLLLLPGPVEILS